jgi:signal transduction histidine kinase/ActR/RegA family two-component response regulator
VSGPGVPSDHDIIHALADDLPVGLWVARAPGGEFVYANRRFAEIMGQTGRGDVAVGGYSEPYGIMTRDGQPYPEHRMPFVRAMQERRVVVVDDITIYRPDRTRVDVRAFANPVTDEAGTITHVAIAFFDITREVAAERARAESEKRLHRAQRMEAIGTLAGGIAHDFNNLSFGIKLIASALRAGETDGGKRESLDLIDEITERSAALTRSLLGFARRGKHRAAPVALDDVVASMREMLSRTLSAIEIEFDIAAADRGTVIGDHAQLEQVVMNLVVNARDALRDAPDARIAVRTSSHDGRVVLEVADNGPGIPAELRDRVFEPYFTTKTQGAERGTGLGLATAYGIVESHGGTIEIVDGLGPKGTTIRVTLPAAQRPAPQAPPRSPIEAVRSGAGTILVVDDDPMVLRALAAALGSLGYGVLEACGGAEAVDLVRERRGEIRAVLLDMVMPRMGGAATYVALRALAPDLVVLLMSGHASNEDVQGLIDLGACGFVSKPYSIEALGSALAAALAAR